MVKYTRYYDSPSFYITASYSLSKNAIKHAVYDTAVPLLAIHGMVFEFSNVNMT